MNQIIAVRALAIGGEQAQAVNARELHAFLEVGKVFAAWIQERITQYGFVAGTDFEVFSETGNNPTGGRPAKEYAISLDMAKELAMVERNEKGKQARQYFIACERRAKLLAKAVQIPQSLPEALRLAADEAERRAAAEAQLAVAAPKAEALDRIATAEGSLCVTDAAKALQMKPRELFNWLSGNHWIYRRTGSPNWIAYQNRIQSGLLEHKVTTVERNDGSEKVTEQVRVTPKGLAKIAEEIESTVPA
ncbi:anti-repressor protein [Cupriavidus metallidurans]|uniref:phage antirepressor KilAC domain-containing protein n=1 Tax=Cupriavidus metallidurans TaxID=119219 RepID=UPI0004933967|nr:phage antirepressor KilAC domain-containing protein [Cupriavidus metallidurans]MDE4918289.1 phage antirepressor KilAC domain-containing protein [Cupriavidus metallidurans]